MEKNFKYWLVFVLLFVWQLPQALLGCLFFPFVGKLTLVADRHYNFCWIGETMKGGISLGPFSFVSKWSGKQQTSIAHEVDGHTVDSKILGPLYLILIGLPSLLNAWFNITDYYYDFYTERLANWHAGLISNGFNLKFKNGKGNYSD